MDLLSVARFWFQVFRACFLITRNLKLEISNSTHSRRMLKKAFSKAAGESKPEAYPQGYVEDFDEPRTPLADFFSILSNLHPLNFFIGRHQFVPDLHHQLEGHIGFL